MNTSFSEQTLIQSCRFSIIEANLTSATKPHTFCQLLKNFFETIRSEDPNAFHYDVARRTLHHLDQEVLKNGQAVDMLARELVKACYIFDENLKLPTEFAKIIKHNQRLQDPYLIIIELTNVLPQIDEQFFTHTGLSLWDNEYCKLLKSIGETGSKQSEELSKKFSQSDLKWDARFWFREQTLDEKEHFFNSPAFLGLAAILWNDIVEKRVQFINRNVSSLSTNVHIPVSKVLNPKTNLISSEKHKQYQLVNGSELVGAIDVPAIPEHILHIVLRGIPKLHSLYGHKIFRYEVQEPFKKMALGDLDYRVIKLDGGQSELAEILGCNGKKAITVIGEILHAQSHLNFKYKGISGNLIQLTKYKSKITGRDDGLEITVGTMLLPYQTFEACRNGDCGLLIPLLKDPPLVGAKLFHANLYSLQMDIMAEFSKQSKELYKDGHIKISKDSWDTLCYNNDIPSSLADRILDRWTRDDEDGAKFIEAIQSDQYTLGKEYAKELAFLKEQGRRRVQASLAGKFSTQTKKQISKKK